MQWAIAEYERQPHTPELVDRTWQALWQAWGERIDHEFSVPSCDRDTGELAELKEKGNGVLLIPDEITTTPEGLVLLGKIFPEMEVWAVQRSTTIKNEHNRGGCIDIEMSVDAPNINTTTVNLSTKLNAEGRDGQRLAVYIVGSQFSKLLTGRYFDMGGTWSLLLGSRDEGDIVVARFPQDRAGRLFVGWSLSPDLSDSPLGGRSEGRRSYE